MMKISLSKSPYAAAIAVLMLALSVSWTVGSSVKVKAANVTPTVIEGLVDATGDRVTGDLVGADVAGARLVGEHVVGEMVTGDGVGELVGKPVVGESVTPTNKYTLLSLISLWSILS
mmetsp:Transcript_2236/g.4093  ORF Transcript_2236/g.4093 Transcript_2236/m.4093 type:complete len:117 (+) Transcript_2236:722-1072(+)